jgi:hypothetical protein
MVVSLGSAAYRPAILHRSKREILQHPSLLRESGAHESPQLKDDSLSRINELAQDTSGSDPRDARLWDRAVAQPDR